jgi:hypothetical protein
MDIAEKREEILLSCEKVKIKAGEIQQSNNHMLVKKMALQVLNRAEIIKQICTPKKYKLFFNGKVAIGKSTTICSLLNLININQLKEDSRLASALLLKTGSGRTTVCETCIYPHSDITLIEIQGVAKNDFLILLKEFCKWLESKESDISEEEIRVIKNMANIPQKFKATNDILEYLSVKPLDSVFDHLNTIINYDSRTRLTYNNEYNLSYEEWIKETFENINDGRIVDCPMPLIITIYIKDSDFAAQVPTYIKAVIDTRGLDGGERVDIQQYINEKDSISLMCDEINAFGGNESILSILKQVLINENRDIKYRVALVGLEKGKELSNINDCGGSREQGIDAKKVEAIKKLQDNGVCFEHKNIFFLNALKGIKVEDGIIDSVNYEVHQNERNIFFSTIENILHKMYISYQCELLDALKTLEQLQIGEITPEILQKFLSCRDSALSIKEKISGEKNNLAIHFKNEILSIYHSSLRGAVNHNGVGRTADVYASFKKCGGENFYEKCYAHKAEIIAVVGEIFKESTDIEKICAGGIVEEIDALYSKYYNLMRDEVFSTTKSTLYTDLAWYAPKSYWGDRLGNYNLRVMQAIMEQMESKKTIQTLENLNLEEKLFSDIAEFLTLQHC